ncbi:unnamed protein product, partial [Sphacelaria rigidula]
MRWNCCDKNEPGTWGSSGCKRRFHLPPSEGDPGFVAAVRKGAAQDRSTLVQLDKELHRLSAKDM